LVLGFNTDSAASVRWIAVHHGDSAGGNDHVHLVANLINETAGNTSSSDHPE